MTRLDIKPLYKKIKGWNSSIENTKDFTSLPEALRSYIQYIDRAVGAKVKYISNGPGREQIIEVP
jgi:adenylosuccinate synthase